MPDDTPLTKILLTHKIHLHILPLLKSNALSKKDNQAAINSFHQEGGVLNASNEIHFRLFLADGCSGLAHSS
jgi:hypothetical protein